MDIPQVRCAISTVFCGDKCNDTASTTKRSDIQAQVVQTIDSAIHRINHYPADKHQQNQLSYPVDGGLLSYTTIPWAKPNLIFGVFLRRAPGQPGSCNWPLNQYIIIGITKLLLSCSN